MPYPWPDPSMEPSPEPQFSRPLSLILARTTFNTSHLQCQHSELFLPAPVQSNAVKNNSLIARTAIVLKPFTQEISKRAPIKLQNTFCKDYTSTDAVNQGFCCENDGDYQEIIDMRRILESSIIDPGDIQQMQSIERQQDFFSEGSLHISGMEVIVDPATTSLEHTLNKEEQLLLILKTRRIGPGKILHCISRHTSARHTVFQRYRCDTVDCGNGCPSGQTKTLVHYDTHMNIGRRASGISLVTK